MYEGEQLEIVTALRTRIKNGPSEETTGMRLLINTRLEMVYNLRLNT